MAVEVALSAEPARLMRRYPERGFASARASAPEEFVAQPRIPVATYRLQLSPSFTFRDTEAIVPYLHQLGISDCYLSPIFAARPRSDHGYDVCDYGRISPELGGEEGFRSLVNALRVRGMGVLLDVVPNHMGIGHRCNAWWMDVLENGPSSVYAAYFDIDWHPGPPELANKVLLPLLGEQYGTALERGELRLSYDSGSFFIHYYDSTLPVAPRSYGAILRRGLDAVEAALGEDTPAVQELHSILTALSYLPPRASLSQHKVAERHREKEVIKRRVASLYETSAAVRAAIDETVRLYNGEAGRPESFDLLDGLLDEQAYRLAYWRVAGEEINYRRFFDINDLAALRVENDEAFTASHRLLFELVAAGEVTGLRVDHADGLWDPAAYLRRVQERAWSVLGGAAGDARAAQATQRWDAESGEGPDPLSIFVVVEKILLTGECLRDAWPAHGTTGYDFLHAVNGIFINGDAERRFNRIYQRFTGQHASIDDLVNTSKKLITHVSMAGEVNALGRMLKGLANANRHFRDFTLNNLTFVLREVVASLPVYRTYVTPAGRVTEEDAAAIRLALRDARRRNPRTAAAVFDFVQDTLLLANLDQFPPGERGRVIEFVMKVQQVSGPVMAKGLEDTACYVANRLLSLNDVGGTIERFGGTVDAFHAANAGRARRWPHALLATATHDTKRGEDVRARLNVLSELPSEWQAALTRWSRLTGRGTSLVDGGRAPSRNDEYAFYQTVVAAWPAGRPGEAHGAEFRDRIAAYMLKATREAKVHTSWINPNQPYDAAVRAFVRRALGGGNRQPFLEHLQSFSERVAFFGLFNSLAQTLLKLTAPGVSDVYQGAELWDLSLVDPDNRRPVDFLHRRRLLEELQRQIAESGRDLSALAQELIAEGANGRSKLYVTHRTLQFRATHAGLFAHGAYVPLSARGEKQWHVCAFARAWGTEVVVVIVPRLVVTLMGGKEQPPVGEDVWGDTAVELPSVCGNRDLFDVFTGEVLSVGITQSEPWLSVRSAFKHFPVALLTVKESR